MIRMTFALGVALYAAFAIWGRPVDGVVAAGDVAPTFAAAPQPVILQNASAPSGAPSGDAAPLVTRIVDVAARPAAPVMPDPAAVIAATPTPAEILGQPPRLIGEAQRITLAPAAAPAAAPELAGPLGDVVEVTGSRVNMRAGPGVGNAVVGALSRGERAEAIGAPEGGWQQIRALDSGVTGFMFASYLSPV
jgi:hypothetical protein